MAALHALFWTLDQHSQHKLDTRRTQVLLGRGLEANAQLDDTMRAGCVTTLNAGLILMGWSHCSMCPSHSDHIHWCRPFGWTAVPLLLLSLVHVRQPSLSHPLIQLTRINDI